MIGSVGFVFVCCEFGHKLSYAFEEIDHVITQLDWYKFPLQLEKLLPILVVCAQQPADLRVFGSVSCAREDFKTVCLTKLINFFKLLNAILFEFSLSGP